MRFAALLSVLTAFGAEPDRVFTETIRPSLEKNCYGCHGVGQVLANLDLRTREGLLKGGMKGPAVTLGNAASSLLYRAITGAGVLQMPPGGEDKKLPPEVIAAIKDWINAGAPWAVAQAETKWDSKPEDLWAFQPLRKPQAPAGRSAIDGFVNAKLAGKGLKAAPAADKRTLIRRVTFDLTGLPPTPDEIDSFLKDPRADAYARLVDRLLASPRYGERWGRHWLDVVRYADTNGYSNDFERPNAWRYRDYVIRSFNDDKPYDRFVREQIAGDEIDAKNPESIIATGFLRAGPWEHTGMSVEAVTRQMFLDDVTNAVGVTFLGLTVGCAKCHDHKFDPIPTKEYYQLQSIFATTEFARPELPFLPRENTADLASGKSYTNRLITETKNSQARYDDSVRALTMKKHGVSRVEDLPKGVLAAAIREKEGISPQEFEEFKLHQKHMQLYRESVDRYEPKAFAVSSGPADGFTDGGQNLRYAARKDYKIPEVHILPGGNIQSPGDKVGPGLLSLAARYSGFPLPEIPDTIAGRRAALANWIADARNPLTARVMVNRIWQYHFGRGLAADSNNFGKMGRKPSHAELIDWLASSFVESGWSVKSMHRLILLSDVYQRSSSLTSAAAKEKDPGNLLLSYFPPQRMSAEMLRDSVLAVAGELSLESGGPGVFPQINEDVARQPRHAMGSLQPAYHESPLKRERNRRTVYTFQQRSLVDPMVDVFNGPNLDVSCENRESSTVPTQAFSLFNGQFAHDMALAFAARLERETKDKRVQIRRAFELAYGRDPSSEELAASMAHLEKQSRRHKTTPPPAKPAKKPVVHSIMSELSGEKSEFVQLDDPRPVEANLHASDVGPETRALADLMLVLLNSNEFVYVY